jgi:hypothetical protein
MTNWRIRELMYGEERTDSKRSIMSDPVIYFYSIRLPALREEG